MNNPERPDPAKANPEPSWTGGATDQVGIGPQDIEVAEASELPDHGRGPVETNIGREMGRKLPQETGGIIGGEGSGLAGEPELHNLGRHGARKGN